jgi:ribonucleoside-diphosphate reductase alpha chain
MNSTRITDLEEPETTAPTQAEIERKGAQLLSRAIPAAERLVAKRDGSRVRFDLNKVTRAIALAFHEVRTDNAPNSYRDDALACYGLQSSDFAEVTRIAAGVS